MGRLAVLLAMAETAVLSKPTEVPPSRVFSTEALPPEVYVENGFADRASYLKHLATEFDVSEETVMTLAGLLGPNEDFDGLVAMLEDLASDL